MITIVSKSLCVQVSSVKATLISEEPFWERDGDWWLLCLFRAKRLVLVEILYPELDVRFQCTAFDGM